MLYVDHDPEYISYVTQNPVCTIHASYLYVVLLYALIIGDVYHIYHSVMVLSGIVGGLSIVGVCHVFSSESFHTRTINRSVC